MGHCLQAIGIIYMHITSYNRRPMSSASGRSASMLDGRWFKTTDSTMHESSSRRVSFMLSSRFVCSMIMYYIWVVLSFYPRFVPSCTILRVLGLEKALLPLLPWSSWQSVRCASPFDDRVGTVRERPVSPLVICFQTSAVFMVHVLYMFMPFHAKGSATLCLIHIDQKAQSQFRWTGSLTAPRPWCCRPFFFLRPRWKE